MTEMGKTAIYIGIALVISAVAYLTRPGESDVEPPDETGKPLFTDFTDPYEAKSLKIVRFDQELGESSTFEVAQKAGQWVIPSHEDYPADAEDQLKEAATALVDLKVLGVASDLAGDHALFGVVEPEPEKSQIGEKGVGTLVSMSDDQGNALADLIIGKKVKDSEDQRFVRMPGRDRIYVVKIDPEKFSTKFEDWIEKDLLDLSAWDIKQVVLKDYSVNTVPTLDGRLAAQEEQRFEMSATWNSDDYKWVLDELKEYRDNSLQASELAEDEELNKEKLDGLKDALDELKIVDVERKPAGLRADLKADEGFMKDREGVRSLIERGFYPIGSDQVEIRSSEGEVLTRTKEGVEYVLRFGQIASVATGSEGSGDEAGSLNRFVFVTARVDEGNFPPPEYEPLPEKGGELTPPPPLSAPAGDEAAAKAQEQPATNGDAEATQDVEPAETSSTTEASDETADEATENTDSETPKEEDQSEGSQDASEADGGSDAAKENAEDERDRIIKENERKRKEYEDKRKKAVDKVKELNLRFADWYYVISEDVYKKIHLSRSDVVKKKEAEKTSEDGENAEFGVDSFREMEQEGLNRDDGEGSN